MANVSCDIIQSVYIETTWNFKKHAHMFNIPSTKTSAIQYNIRWHIFQINVTQFEHQLSTINKCIMHKSSLYVGQDKVNVNEVNSCNLRDREGNIGWRYANPYVLYCCYNCKSNEYSSDLKASLLSLLISTSHYDCEFMFSLSKQRKS